MDKPNSDGATSVCSQTQSGKMKCPKCQHPVRPKFINKNEKMFICTNTHCDFPFDSPHIQMFIANKAEVEAVKRVLSTRLQ